MKTKRIFIIILLAAFCILLSACPGVVPTVVLGNLLSVDGSGHFTQDITYSGGSTTYELNADGTFTITQKDYAGNISNGYKGTYSWAQDTMLLTYNYSQYYDSGSNQWEDYLDAKTETLHYYFSDQHLGYAYAKVANTENTFTNEDRTVIANGNTTTETTTVTITATSFTYNYTYTVDNSAGERTYGERITVNGTIDALYPAGVTWARGQHGNRQHNPDKRPAELL